jgi:hypothetical protein
MQKPEIVLVPCDISPGMFPGEYAVEISLKSGKVLSLFAEASDLEDINLPLKSANLKVKVLCTNEANDEMLVYLPKESLETGNHLLELPRELVKIYA